jgi:hypothetical protein
MLVGRHFRHSCCSVGTPEQPKATSRSSNEAGVLKSAEVTYKICEPLAEQAKKTIPL